MEHQVICKFLPVNVSGVAVGGQREVGFHKEKDLVDNFFDLGKGEELFLCFNWGPFQQFSHYLQC